MYDLKLLADDLWKEATPVRLERFSRQLRNTKTEIEKASLFIEENHYRDLTETINFFSEYQIGKSDLINYRQANNFDNYTVEQMIAENGAKKTAFEALLFLVKADLKSKLADIEIFNKN